MDCIQNAEGGKDCVPQCLPTFTFEREPPAKYVCGKNGTWTPDVTLVPDCIQAVDLPTTSAPRTTAARISSDAMCGAWGTNHYRTFDNKVYTFDGPCRYTLVHAPNQFDILARNKPNCLSACSKEIDVYQSGNQISFAAGASGPEIKWNGQLVTVPGFKEGIVFEKVGGYITMSSNLGYNIKWDGKQSVFIKVSDEFLNKITGLCGKYNKIPTDDFETPRGTQVTDVGMFGASWKKEENGNVCAEPPQKTGCDAQTPEITQKAQSFCDALTSDASFLACSSKVDPTPFKESCKTDCCNAGGEASCMCDTMEAYSRSCMDKGANITWRTQGRCAISCPNNMVYKECGSSCAKDCTNVNSVCPDTTCVDGCFCPDGQVLHNGNCIPTTDCLCEKNSQTFREGEIVPEKCNNCTCHNGAWNCTKKSCDKTCSATGDPHYETFDGKRYNFMGTCSYYLMKDRDFNVIVDNIQCGHGDASCTKSISIDIQGLNIKLDHNHQLFINGREITTLPYVTPEIKVTMVSSLFMQATLSNGISILWDGRTRAYIKAPAEFYKKTIGLCGTFDGDQTNDFKTLEGNVETNPNIFGNQWKTEQSCANISEITPQDPCDANPQKKDQALALCQKLKGDIFKACHNVIDVTTYYEDCLYDLCSCTANMKDCMCPNMGSYADTCATKGIQINWRLQIPECLLQCPAGQQYTVCARPCERTCRDIAENKDPDCDTKCVEGCNCLTGQTLNDQGQCVPIADCPCIFNGKQYPSGYTTVLGSEICVCENAKFVCSAVPPARVTLPPTNPPPLCPLETSVYTRCKSNCPLTCDNMHNPPNCSKDNCDAGCECLPGLVLDGDNCVNASLCPCHHAGNTYHEGESYFQECNQCTCKNRQWQCTNNTCPSSCSAYGDSHYTTFDGRRYEFQGVCDYVLVKSTDDSPYNYAITTHNTQCGTTGVTCAKQIDFTVGTEGTDNFYKLQLISGQSVVPDPGSPFSVKEVGDMVYITTPFGVTVQWDKGTRVYVRLTKDHMRYVEGLCGNFNQDSGDDFIPKQGGNPVNKATAFGDSWKVQSSCAPSLEITDTCSKNPQRKAWAHFKCSVLNSDLFQPCHNVVDRTDFVRRCEFDACACDLGGDCECLCTAIAAYAHECAVNGVPINWRSNDLCPIQCEQCETFNPCISLCPKKTCGNKNVYSAIASQCSDLKGLCFEGCDLNPCPPGQVYDSLTDPVSCIPESLCETPSCDINGKTYKEGERIEDPSACRTECEICICRNTIIEHITFGKCEPVPMHTPTPQTTTTAEQPGQKTTENAGTPHSINDTNGVCDELLGSYQKDIAGNDLFSASSSQSVAYEAHQARLFNTHSGADNGGAWVPRLSDLHPYITLKLQRPDLITGVVLQGVPNSPQWVTEYSVETSIDGVHFQPYMDSRQTGPKVFKGNFDSNTPVKGFFDREVPAIAVRIYPNKWVGAAGLRFDLLVCNGAATLVPPTIAYGETPTPTPFRVTGGTPTKAPTVSYPGGATTLTPPPGQHQTSPTLTPPFTLQPDVVCNVPMNVDLPPFLPDNQLSSTLSITPPGDGRLNGLSSWIPAVTDQNQWLQVDFLLAQNLSGILTQGSPNAEKWVSSYMISTSLDDLTFYPLRGNDGNIFIFKGNSDKDSIVRNYFPHPVIARYIRIIPLTWAPNGPGLRINYLGCISKYNTPRPTEPLEIPTPTTMATPPPGVTTAAPTPQILPPTVPFFVPTPTPVCGKEMGLQSQQIIKDSQITASSSKPFHGPQLARLSEYFYQGSWMPLNDDTSPYIQVNFQEPKFLSGVVTQGEGTEERWVTEYKVYTSMDGVDFVPYSAKQDGATIFKANTDSNTPVTNLFVQNILAQYIRIYPVGSHMQPALRFDVLGCNPSLPDRGIVTPSPPPTTTTEKPTLPFGQTPKPTLTPPPIVLDTISPPTCLLPMGLSSHYIIANDQMTSSSNLDKTHTVSDGRLNNVYSSTSGGSWIPGSETNQWVTVKFDEPKLLSGVVTQGSPDSSRWVKTYYIYYSLNGVDFIPYTEYPGSQTPYLFRGNTDSNTPVRNLLNREIIAQYIKIVPVEAGPSGIGLRFDVLGCKPDIPKLPPSLTPPTVSNETPPTPGTGTTLTPPTPVTIKCDVPMGISNPLIIGDQQLSASTSLDEYHGPTRGRIFTYTDGVFAGGWSPRTSDEKPYLQVDLLSPYKFSGVTTQGSADQPSWVTKYSVYFSTDGITFEPVKDNSGNPIVFNGNTDQHTPVTNFFPTEVARYIQIRPVESHNGITLRFNLLGCETPRPTPVVPITQGVTWSPTISEKTTLTPPPGQFETTMGPPTFAIPVPNMICNFPMNVDRPSMIANQQLTASSQFNSETSPSAGRLDNQFSSWVPLVADSSQWLQVDFQTPQNLSGVLTQGSPDSEKWVSSFLIRTSMDGLTYYPVRNNQDKILVFPGNSDKDSIIRNYFPRVIIARYVQIVPLTWAPSGPGLRLNYIGCYSTSSPTPRPPLTTAQPTIPTGSVVDVTTKSPPIITPYVPPEPLCTKQMGLENEKIIEDSQITASSSIANHGPEMARLYTSSGAWIPSNNDEAPYIQVNFKEQKFLSGVVTQGQGLEEKWVTEYRISYSSNGVDFYPYSQKQDGVATTYSANSDSNSPVTNMFVHNIIAQYIRIIPVGSHMGFALRFDVLGCNPSLEPPRLTPPPLVTGPTPTPGTGPTPLPTITPKFVCDLSMGLTNPLIISNNQLSASSSLDGYHGPSRARLYLYSNGLYAGGWSPRPTDPSPYIQVDLLSTYEISGVTTQGSADQPSWVTKYTVYYSDDDIYFMPVKDNSNNPIVFSGNTDQYSPVSNYFPQVIEARYIQIRPVESHNSISLRFNLLGCNTPVPTAPTPHITYTSQPTLGIKTTATPPTGHLTNTPTVPVSFQPPPELHLLCNIPMNVDRPSMITSSQLTSSSQLNLQTSAANGRLENSLSSWVPSMYDNFPWHQVDFKTPQNLSGVITQGSPDSERWVSSFTVSTSMDGLTFFPVQNQDGHDIVFSGNQDKNTLKRNYFPHIIVARFVRIQPLSWAPNGPGLRLNYIGCFSSLVPTERPPLETLTTQTPPVVVGPTTVTPTPPPLITPTPYGVPICTKSMGLQDQRIVDDQQLSATSSDRNHEPKYARLSEYDYQSSWIPG
uniref:Hemocytin n=1 Tax=Biomphalaria glabrata TaxID=6526 RepID=A0A2C9M9G4_BIOGL